MREGLEEIETDAEVKLRVAVAVSKIFDGCLSITPRWGLSTLAIKGRR